MIAAGFRYFAIIFVAGFVFGTIRTLWLAPALGATAAVSIELPLMVLVSWLTAAAILRRAPGLSRAAATGAGLLAFALLMIVEAALAVIAFGMSFTGWLASLGRMPGPIGLAGQIVFALIPSIVRRRLARRVPRY